MRVLVTGGAGFIGSHTVDALLKKGLDVTVLDSLEVPVHMKGKPAYLPEGIRFIHGDVRKREDLREALEGAEAVFHFAAYQDYLTDFSKFFSVNAVGTALLYELIVGERLPVEKVVVASSQAVYGEGRYRCSCTGTVYPEMRGELELRRGRWEIECRECGSCMESDATPEDVVNPGNQYAVSKYSQELIALGLGKRYSIPTVALRYSIVQGPRQSFYNAYSGALRIFALSLLLGKTPPVYEDGLQKRDYVNIEDVVRANILAFEDRRANWGVFNVGGARPYTVLELLGAISGELGVECAALPEGRYRFGDTRHIVSDISRLRALGWSPAHTIGKSVADYVKWLRSQERLEDILDYAAKNMERLGVVRRAG